MESDSDYAIHLPDEIVQFCVEKYKSNEFVPQNFEEYVFSCMRDPNAANIIRPNADPITLLVYCYFNVSFFESSFLLFVAPLIGVTIG